MTVKDPFSEHTTRRDQPPTRLKHSDAATGNQPPAFEDVNLFTTDVALMAAVERDGAGHALGDLETLGATAGSAWSLAQGRDANAYPPVLRDRDERGERIDQVTYHPAYGNLMQISMEAGLHCASWGHLEGGGTVTTGANVARAAGLYLAAQMEPGHCCPVTMTNAAVVALNADAGMAKTIIPKILNRTYDDSFRHMSEKASLTIGMGMTERHGGTDVDANATRAERISGEDGDPADGFLLNGHKWFLSAPMSDAFLVTAHTDIGLSCFLMPRILPDGETNGIHFERLKSKLGNHSNASAEVTFDDAQAWLIGEEGRGLRVIMEMVNYTRLDCAVSSAGIMRWCLANAIHHASHRRVFGRPLIVQPVMMQVLADMALQSEAATMLVMRLARSFDFPDDEQEAAWRRLMTPVVKYWVCKTAPALASEAMECLGGNGYAETFPIARAYRELPVNAIWEGSGNVMCLDVMRVLQSNPETVDLVFLELQELSGGDPALAAQHQRIRELLHDPRNMDHNLRALTEQLALAAAGVLMNAHAARVHADGFIASRISGPFHQTFGAHRLADAEEIVEAASPVT